MKTSWKFGAGLALCGLLAGCAHQPRYEWGGYEGGLYSYYKTPASEAQFTEELGEDIKDAEAAGRVAPGMYAEYGFMLMKAGKKAEARAMFLKEKTLWPESAKFMDVLLKDTEVAAK